MLSKSFKFKLQFGIQKRLFSTNLEGKTMKIPFSKNQQIKNYKLLKKLKEKEKYDIQGKPQDLEDLGYRRFDHMLFNTGLTSRSLIDRFLKDNEVLIGIERMIQPDKIRRYVDPETVTVNGQKIPFLDPITVALWKQEGIMSYATTKAPRRAKDVIRLQNEGFEEIAHIYNTILPEEFEFRRPSFVELFPLDPDQSGLQIITQKPFIIKKASQTILPLKRTYIFELEDKLTGLEIDAFEFFKCDNNSIPIPKPIFEQISEKIGKITFFDSKPDNLREILLSIRHKPIYIQRVAFGGISILEGQKNINLHKESDWIVLSDKEERELTKELKHRKEWQERKLRMQHLMQVEHELKMKIVE